VQVVEAGQRAAGLGRSRRPRSHFLPEVAAAEVDGGRIFALFGRAGVSFRRWHTPNMNDA
jgi:hypothetical protein